MTIITGCDKDAALRKTVSESIRQINGNYKILSMEWKGSPEDIDLDGDGIANSDIYAEFEGLSTIHFTDDNIKNANIYILSNVSCSNTWPVMRTVHVNLYIPLQHVKQISGEYIAGSENYATMLKLNGYIHDNGDFEFERFASLPELSSSLEDESALSDGNLQFIAPRELQFDVNYLFYDYRTKRIVTGPVCIKFGSI